MRRRRFELDLIETLMRCTPITENVVVNAVVVLERPFPANVQGIGGVARQSGNDGRTGTADIGALDDHIRRVTNVFPSEGIHVDRVLAVRFWKLEQNRNIVY